MDTITKLGTILASFVVCQIFFHIVSSWISTKVFPSFNDLSFEKKIDWNQRVVSTCHALVVGVLYLYSLLFDKTLRADPIGGDLSLMTMTIAIAAGYLISALLLSVFFWRVIGDIVHVIHRCAALFACCLILFQMGEALVYIGNFHLIRPLSTPFTNQLYFLHILEYSQFSEAYIISGVLGTVMFFLVRVAVIPSFYYFIYCMYGTDNYVMLELLIQWFWIGSYIVIDMSNVMLMIKFIMPLVNIVQYSYQRTESPHN